MLGLLTTLCPRCGKHRNPHEVNELPGGAKICWGCIENHEKALLVLAGALPTECQECLTPSKLIAARARGERVQFGLVLKDGIYQVLCMPCREKYHRKRADFFKGTAYAERKKLAGAK